MKQSIVVHKPRWKFWRWSVFGLNPFGWIGLSEIWIPEEMDEEDIFVAGHSRPGGGGGGLYRFNANHRGLK